MNSIKKIAQFANEFKLEETSEEVIKHAKLILLDSLASLVYGNQTEEVIRMKEIYDSDESITSVPVLGTSSSMSPQKAALINGLGMVSQELDEGNPYAKAHPSSHILPGLLSVAKGMKSKGKEFLQSFLIGYEVGTRIGYAIDLKAEIHPHGNAGLIGGAVSISKLKNFSSLKIENAIYLSASLPLVSLWESAYEGHRVRDAYMGIANVINTFVADLVNAGYTGSKKSLEIIYKDILGQSFQPERIVESLGKEYYLTKNYFKFYPYCRYCHSPIEALENLLNKQQLDVNEIERINVYTYKVASLLDLQNVANDFAKKFSIPAALGDVLSSKSNSLKSVDFANRVFVYNDEEINQKLPNERNSRVEVILNNGQSFSEYQVGAKGDHNNPPSELEIKNKIKNQIVPIIGEESCQRLIDVCMDIEKYDLDDLLSVCKI